MRNPTSDLRSPRSDDLPLSHRDSSVGEVYSNEVRITCVLHTARISNTDSVRMREMESFELGKEIGKDVFRQNIFFVPRS